jgi:uncharacterized protein (DUF3084 family)
VPNLRDTVKSIELLGIPVFIYTTCGFSFEQKEITIKSPVLQSSVQVLRERAQQIEDKMAEVRAEQAESIERREHLLQELDMANQLTKREVAKQEEDKIARKHELEAQVKHQPH